MSFVGSTLSACLQPSASVPDLKSIDDLGGVRIDESAVVMVCSRNGWINHRLEEISRTFGMASLPSRTAQAIVLSGTALDQPITELRAFLQRLSRDPLQLPEPAREYASEDEVRRCVTLAPASLDEALAAFAAACSRDEEREGLETLVCLLWCQLRLAEHARHHDRCFISVRGD